MANAPNLAVVLAELDRIIRDAERDADPLGFFAALYRAVTWRVGVGIEAGRFADGARMDRFDARFAGRYLDALHAWRTGAALTRSWRHAFGAAPRADMTILQHLLLGMNAHINLDLVIVTVEFGAEGSLEELAYDFEAINDILAELLNDVQRVIDDFSPAFRVLDRALLLADESLANFSLRRARRDAWYHARAISRMRSDERPEALVQLDRRTALLARLIHEPGGVVGHTFLQAKLLESDDTQSILRALAALR